MTAQTVAPIPLTDQELTILREFGRGADVAAIADQLGIDRKPVGDVVIDWCNLNRGRARELARGGVRPAPKPTAPVKRERRTSMPEPTRGQVMVASAKRPDSPKPRPVTVGTEVPTVPPTLAPQCHYCPPGYRYGDEGCRHTPPAAGDLVDRLMVATLDPLERWVSNRCPTCRYVGPTGEHPTRCDGQPVPVTIVVLPEVA